MEKKLQETFAIDETEVNGNVTLFCIRTLSDISPKSKHFQSYAANFWVHHLSDATSTKHYNDLLISLYQFFISDALEMWIRASLRKIPRYERNESLDIHVEEIYVSKIKEWLGKASEVERLIADVRSMDLINAHEWSEAIRHGDQQLGEFIGKASANVWLYDDIPNFNEVQTTFLLALKYYRQWRNQSSCNSEKITDLSATGFRDISIWAGGQKRHIKNGSLGVAHFTLYEWEACIQCFRKEVNSNPDEFTLWSHFGEAYTAKGDQ